MSVIALIFGLQWITNLSSFTHFHWPISLLIWISKESPDESWPSSSPVQLDLFFLPAQIQLSRSVSPPTSQLSKRDFKRTSKVSQWETSKSLLGNIFLISFFITHIQPFQNKSSNKSHFPRFTFKKKAFDLRKSGLTSLKLKSWATLFSKWSVLEESASWKYHASALWTALGPTLCPSIGERLGNFFWWPGKAGIGTGLRLGKRLPDGRGVGSLMEKTKPALGKGAHKE